MQKIIIDTNVIVSSLIQKNYPYYIVYYLLIEKKFQLCVSDKLLSEYYEVLTREKFLRFQDFIINAKILLATIEAQSLRFYPSIKIDIISDKDDNMILELAHESKADFIITGNTSDFTFTNYKRTKIVTPKEYWELYKPG